MIVSVVHGGLLLHPTPFLTAIIFEHLPSSLNFQQLQAVEGSLKLSKGIISLQYV